MHGHTNVKSWNSVTKLVEQGEEIGLKRKVEKVSSHTQYDSPLGANIFLFDIAMRQTCSGTLPFCHSVCQVQSQAWREGTAVRKSVEKNACSFMYMACSIGTGAISTSPFSMPIRFLTLVLFTSCILVVFYVLLYLSCVYCCYLSCVYCCYLSCVYCCSCLVCIVVVFFCVLL